MKLRPVLFQFDVPNLRSARQNETWKTVATILQEGILDKEPIKKYINETALQRHLEFHGCESDSFDDYSKAYFPHLDFKNGFPISLNIIGKVLSNGFCCIKFNHLSRC